MNYIEALQEIESGNIICNRISKTLYKKDGGRVLSKSVGDSVWGRSIVSITAFAGGVFDMYEEYDLSWTQALSLMISGLRVEIETGAICRIQGQQLQTFNHCHNSWNSTANSWNNLSDYKYKRI